MTNVEVFALLKKAEKIADKIKSIRKELEANLAKKGVYNDE